MADGQFNQSPQAAARIANEQAEKDWATAIEIIKAAVSSFGSQPPANDLAVQKRCQALWDWAKVDTWTPPQGS